MSSAISPEGWDDPDRRDGALLHALCDVYRATDPDDLSPTELRCIEAASVGMDSAEGAVLLGVGVETYKSHLKRARRKMRAKNTTHAVALAFRAGLIR